MITSFPRELATGFRCVPFIIAALLSQMAAEAQISKRKGGFGSLFKNQSSRNENPEPGQVDARAVLLKDIVMRSLPADRHYREILADAIVLTYQRKNFKNLWNHRQMPDRLYRSLSQHLLRHGVPELMALDPNSFGGIPRKSPVNSRDLGYTIAIADSGALVRLGPAPREVIWSDWDKGDRPGLNRDTAETLAEDLLKVSSYRSFNAGAAIDSMASRNWIYRELQNGFVASLRAASKPDQYPTIPDPATTGIAKPGQPYAYAGQLAETLALRGHLTLSPDERRSLQFISPELAAGIKNFQQANGLTADGIMGSGTWKVLTMSPAQQLKTRAINLHRARLLPDDFGERYIIINLPSAELFTFNGRELDFTMRVVLGRSEEEEFHTPVFRDVMREVVFAPYWNVPESISVKEIYPKLLENPNYLTEKHYEIVNNFRDDASVFELNEETLAKIETAKLYLRQKPTPGNALGKVKFLLPNQFNIYLHDTPSKQYFAMDNRAQSHGCVRLADPPKMAEWTLKSQGWDQSKISVAMDSSTQIREKLATPINVYLTYFTSFPRPSGTSAGEFILAPARDIYKLDIRDSAALASVLP